MLEEIIQLGKSVVFRIFSDSICSNVDYGRDHRGREAAPVSHSLDSALLLMQFHSSFKSNIIVFKGLITRNSKTSVVECWICLNTK